MHLRVGVWRDGLRLISYQGRAL